MMPQYKLNGQTFSSDEFIISQEISSDYFENRIKMANKILSGKEEINIKCYNQQGFFCDGCVLMLQYLEDKGFLDEYCI